MIQIEIKVGVTAMIKVGLESSVDLGLRLRF